MHHEPGAIEFRRTSLSVVGAEELDVGMLTGRVCIDTWLTSLLPKSLLIHELGVQGRQWVNCGPFRSPHEHFIDKPASSRAFCVWKRCLHS